ncbi:MAG: phosphoglucosamine mutase, partial [Candidatus Zixiibacteriota bacterium]
VVDAVNGAGSVALPELLRQLGVRVITLNCRPDGLFPHPPEPTPDNLAQLSRAVRRNRADLGLATDPDADRLALVDERGRPIVRQVLSVRQSPVVINLSTSRVTADVARELGQKVYYSRVGEANVVALMKKRSSIIGGEGNGGVIYGALHYGRDSLAAAALALSSLAQSGGTLSELAGTLPTYYTIKGKAPLPQSFSSRLKEFERRMLDQWGGLKVDRRDGVRLDFPEGWVLIRASNTEPIYRIVVETTGAAMTRKIMKQTRGFFR